MKLKASILICFLLYLASPAYTQKVISLPEAKPSGSLTWANSERQYFSPIWNTEVVTNVAHPTLTVFLPPPALSNGTAVVICPGGGFRALSINSEGNDVAKWLNAKGVAAFVLKYRLVPSGEDAVKEMSGIADRKRFDEENASIVPLEVSDGLTALTYVRQHAAEYKIAPNHIGIMGFSAGGTITAGVTFGYSSENRPDFVAPIYAYLGALKETNVPADAPPMFIAAATDDQLNLALDSVALYGKWLAAKKSVEVHIYSKGGHGFGMRKQNLPSDQWIERFGEWLRVQGFLQK
jgi:acetyl esterase/lipase